MPTPTSGTHWSFIHSTKFIKYVLWPICGPRTGAALGNGTDLLPIFKIVPNKCHHLVSFHGFLDYHEQPVCLSLSMHLGSQRSRRHLAKLCPSPHSTLILVEKLRKCIQWINVGATPWAPMNSKSHKRKPALPSWVMSWRSSASSSAGGASARLVLSLLKLLICIAVIILQNIFTSIFSLDSPW